MSLFYIFQSSLVRNTFNALSGVTLDGILQQKLSLCCFDFQNLEDQSLETPATDSILGGEQL